VFRMVGGRNGGFICSLRDLGFLNNAIQSGAQRGSQDRHTSGSPGTSFAGAGWPHRASASKARGRIIDAPEGDFRKRGRGGSESRLSASTHPERPAPSTRDGV